MYFQNIKNTSRCKQNYQLISNSRFKIKSGFTLIELLVAISLMVFLISIVAYIFRAATTVYSQNEDIITIANNARSILEFLNRDLMGTLSPSSTSRQCFRLVNGGENNFTKAKDQFGFNSITTVLGQTRPVRVEYKIIESKVPKTKVQRVTKITRTLLWKFERYVTEVDGSEIVDKVGKSLEPETLSEYLVFFNIQYDGYEDVGAGNSRFFELDEQPGTDENGNSYMDMISTDLRSGNCIGDGQTAEGGKEEPKLPRRLVFYYQIFANEKEQVQKTFRHELSIQAR